MFHLLVAWQARVHATRVVATDGSRSAQRVQTATGDLTTISKTTSAAVRHDGHVDGGALDSGDDNYKAELVALVAALEGQGESVIVVFDAQSPVRAWMKFARSSARRRQDYRYAELLGELDARIRQQRAVVLLWQTSHVGEPVNSWADMMADEMPVDDPT